MAAVSKTIGATLTVLGLLLLLAGLGAAAYGLYDQDQHRHDLVQNQDRKDTDRSAMVGGATAAALGLVLFLAGLITLLSSRSKPIVVASAVSSPSAASDVPSTPLGATASSSKEARAIKPVPHSGDARRARSAQDTQRTPTAYATPSAQSDSMRRNALLAGTIGFVLVALLVAGVFYAQSGDTTFFHGSDAPKTEVLLNETYSKTVQGGAAVIPGVPVPSSYSFGDNAGDFTPPAGTTSCSLTVDWTKPNAGGADTLNIEISVGGKKVADETGQPGFTVTLAQANIAGAVHHFALFPADDGSVVSQPFKLHVVCIGTPAP